MPYTDETLLRDYGKLSKQHKSKAEKYIKNLLRLQKADKALSKAAADVEKELRKIEPPELPKTIRCSFCGKTEHKCRKLVDGPNNVFICDECIGICDEIMDDKLGGEWIESDEDEPGEDRVNAVESDAETDTPK